MRTLDWWLIMAGVLINASAQMLLKLGAGKLGAGLVSVSLERPVAALWAVATCWPIIVGLFCYAASVLIWIAVLTRVEVSVAYPMLSIGYVVTTLLAWRFFHEDVSPMRLIGVAVICVGVVIVGRSAKGH